MIAAAVFLVYVAVPYFGNKALIVRSGSMQPAIAVGDLVVVKGNDRLQAPAPGIFPKYKVGDVVAFSSEKNSKVLTTHRIVSVQTTDGEILYQTRGDANNTPDANLVAEQKILGKSTFTIGGLGKIFAVAKTKQGFLALVVAPAVLVILFEIFNIAREIGKVRRKNGANNIYLRLFLPFVLATMFFHNSFASYADTEISTGNLFQAAQSFSTASPTPSPIAQTLVINEVLPDTSCSQGNTEAQWIEVYNGYSTTVNLKDYDITDGTNTIDLVTANSVNVPSGGFALLAHNSAIWNGCYGDNGAITANLGGNLDIDTEFLQLRDPNAVVIDTVQWGGATGLNPIQNQSIERDPDGLDSAIGVNFSPSDFVVRTTPQPGL